MVAQVRHRALCLCGAMTSYVSDIVRNFGMSGHDSVGAPLFNPGMDFLCNPPHCRSSADRTPEPHWLGKCFVEIVRVLVDPVVDTGSAQASNLLNLLYAKDGYRRVWMRLQRRPHEWGATCRLEGNVVHLADSYH